MPRSRRFGRSRFTLILLILASLTVLTLDYRDTGPVQGARRVASTAFSPFRGVGEAVASPFRNGWNGIFGYEDLERENADLRRQLDAQEGQEIELDAALRENEELRRQAGLPVRDDIPRTAAEVVGGPQSNFDTTIEINKGAGDGIRAGMAVITDAGLVGQVLRVEGGRARVRLVTDPDYDGVGIRVVESGEVGFAEAGSDGNLSVDGGIREGSPVERGDTVVTSGFDRSSYPGGIPVGTVLSVGLTGDRTEQTLVVEPAVDLNSLRFVHVLLCDTDCG